MIFHTRASLWDYTEALSAMQDHVLLLQQKKGEEEIWFLEHFPVYTTGPCTNEEDIPLSLAKAQNIPIVKTNRGGQATYHGPGQRVVYILADLKKRQLSVHEYIRCLENWIIQSLHSLHIKAQTQPGQTGVWLLNKKKIASLGIRVSCGIASHGFALNVSNSLQPFEQIIACGNQETAFSSVSEESSCPLSMKEIDLALIKHCPF